jgi:hypothetical protein
MRLFECNVISEIGIQYHVTRHLVRRERQSLLRGQRCWTGVRSPMMFGLMC